MLLEGYLVIFALHLRGDDFGAKRAEFFAPSPRRSGVAWPSGFSRLV
jgi:hypothetical protein